MLNLFQHAWLRVLPWTYKTCSQKAKIVFVAKARQVITPGTYFLQICLFLPRWDPEASNGSNILVQVAQQECNQPGFARESKVVHMCESTSRNVKLDLGCLSLEEFNFLFHPLFVGFQMLGHIHLNNLMACQGSTPQYSFGS